jgi:two-component system sensor histidine kinase ChvG
MIGWPRWLRVRLGYRFLIVNVVIVAVPIVGIGFARFYEREMLRGLEEDMIHQAQIVKQLVLHDPAGPRLADRRPLLAAAARDTRARIRLVDERGVVVADSGRAALPFASLMSVIDRREIAAALRGRYGAATRPSWDGRLYLFSALPIVKDGRVLGVVYVTRATTPVKLAMFRLRSTLWRVLGIVLVGTAVISLFLGATISRPLARMTRTAERIAAGERLDMPEQQRGDEVGQLARAFESMTRKLDDRARLTAELAADVSHEFKSPLTGIRGAAELLLDGAHADPAARARFLENILCDAHRLDRLVTRLLELSRIEADPAEPESIDWEGLVYEAAAAAPAQSTAIAVDYAAARTHLRGRRQLLLSALRNLIDNAVQHASPGTEVTVRVTDGARDDRLVTVVHNHGVPIRPANLQRVWDRFFTTRAERGGTGLGLSIVGAVVRSHGGAVSVTSDAADGTAFVIDLPAEHQGT